MNKEKTEDSVKCNGKIFLVSPYLDLSDFLGREFFRFGFDFVLLKGKNTKILLVSLLKA